LLEKVNKGNFREDKKFEETLRYIEMIAKESVRCRTIVKNLLAFSQESEPKIRKIVDIKSILERTLQVLEKQEGRIKFKRELRKKVIYLDGCDIGRHCGIYDEPRNVLRAIPGLELIEFDYCRKEGFCCGGPLLSTHPTLSAKIASSRVREADEKGAEMSLSLALLAW
jgi:Fe-S oxidoreductase